MEKTVSLTPAALNWLGSGFEKKTKISPFATAPGGEFTQSGLDNLIQQGVVSEDKTMTTEAYALFEILAGATKFASVHLSGGSGHINRITYWNGDKVVSLDNAGGMITVTPGNSFAGPKAIIEEITGANRLVSSDFSATMDHRSALIFTGLFDLSRQAAIRLYVDNTSVPSGFSAQAVTDFIANANNARWLTSHLKGLKIPGLQITAAEATTGLNSLVETGIIANAPEDSFTLAFSSAELAAHFLFIENILHFRVGQETDGQVTIAESMYLQAGIHDIIHVDVSAKSIDISAVSSYAMTAIIKKMMTTAPSF